MIVLVLVCISTATLFVMLALELGRLMLGAQRENLVVDRLMHGVAGGVKGVLGVTAGASVPPTVDDGPAVAEAPTSADAPASAEPPTSAEAPTTEAEDQTWVRHDLEVEQLVRDRLYGARRLRERRD